MTYLFVQPGEHQLTTLEFLQRQFPDLPRGYLAQLLKRGRFRGAGRPLAADTLLAAGEVVLLPQGAGFQARVAAASPPLLFESEAALVVNKPALLAVHAGLGHADDNLLRRLAATFRRRGAPYRLHPVHRLDRETSGALLLAKGRRAAGEFGRQLMAGDVGKTYLALVHGHPAAQGILDAPLSIRGRVRASRTSFRTLHRFATMSLLEIELHSGRTHQIRRHLAAAGHPLAGDRRYGSRSGEIVRTQLHCRALRFRDPAAGVLTVRAPLAEEMLALLLRAGLTGHPAVPELDGLQQIEGPALCKPSPSE